MAINATPTHNSVMHHSSAKTSGATAERETHGLSHYKELFIMLGAHFVIMFAVMYTMVDGFADVFMNLNQVYMTGMMVAPMAIMMVMHMKGMLKSQKINLGIYLGSALLFAVLFAFMRDQTLIGDKQFVRSMIPHHSGAVLMCRKASLTDPELKDLCSKIINGQKAEIEQMKNIFSRL